MWKLDGEGRARRFGGEVSAGRRGEAGRTIAPGFSTRARSMALLTVFLQWRSRRASPGRFVQRRRRPVYFGGRVPASHPLETRFRDVQANVPAEQPSPQQDARLPVADADAGGPRDPRQASREGPREALGLINRSEPPTAGFDVGRVLRSGRPFHADRVVAFV